MPKENHVKKKVVYLLGAGASHSVIKYFDPTNDGILMPHIASAVLTELETEKDCSLKELCTIPESEGENKYQDVDIESIITLYESSGTSEDIKRTRRLRNLFRLAVSKRINKASRASSSPPDMITALIDMHSLSNYDEELSAVLTINYDNLIEEAMTQNYGSMNIPFEVRLENSNYVIDRELPPICKLHGSFNWENTNPVRINNNLFIDSGLHPYGWTDRVRMV
jgi:hypothetical protein